MTGVPLAIRWGTEKEFLARNAYVAKMKKQGHKELHCKATGLTLLPSHSYIGRVIRWSNTESSLPQGQNGLLEIKCPYSIGKTPIRNMPLIEIAQAFSQQFFIKKVRIDSD